MRYKLNRDGRLHGAIRCVDCCVKASSRKRYVRLSWPDGQPRCERCEDDRRAGRVPGTGWIPGEVA